jgi:catechol 2,3-dioxygenase-like lactoylglutathione lyase family enzyme
MDMKNVGIKHIAFIVDKIEPVIDRALAHGGKIIQPAKQGMTVKRKAFISDPDGIPIELVELN